jgi:hypothetical protein
MLTAIEHGGLVKMIGEAAHQVQQLPYSYHGILVLLSSYVQQYGN